MSRAAPPAALEVVTFQLSGEVLAVPMRHLREVLEPVAVTRVPGAPRFAAGLFNVRGRVVPLADLRVPLRLPVTPPGPEARILVLDLDLDGGPAALGIHADRVHEVTRIEAADLAPPPEVGGRWPARLVSAVGRWAGGFVTLPDLPAILAGALADPLPSVAGPVPAPRAQDRSPCD